MSTKKEKENIFTKVKTNYLIYLSLNQSATISYTHNASKH